MGITAVSIVLDIIYMSTHHQNWFIRLITIVILILKVRISTVCEGYVDVDTSSSYPHSLSLDKPSVSGVLFWEFMEEI